MPRARVPRLSWVRFFPEDFLGGTQQMDCRQVGQYILALCAQWGAERGAERTGLRPADGALRAVLRGEDLDPTVRAKFIAVEINGQTFLRNRRMSLEIANSTEEWDARVRGAERTAERGAERTAERGAERGAERQQPQPQPQPQRTDPQEQPTSTDTPPTPPRGGLARFVDAFNAIYERRVKAPPLTKSQQAWLKALIAAHGEDGACCLPLLAWCYDKQQGGGERIRTRAVAHLLRNGERGTFEWSSLLERPESLLRQEWQYTARVWRIARELGLAEALERFGCVARVEAPPPKEFVPATPEQLEAAKLRGIAEWTAKAKAEQAAALAARIAKTAQQA